MDSDKHAGHAKMFEQFNRGKRMKNASVVVRAELIDRQTKVLGFLGKLHATPSKLDNIWDNCPTPEKGYALD